MEIEKIKEKITHGKNTTYVEDQLLLVDEIVDFVLYENKFGVFRKSEYTKDFYLSAKNLLAVNDGNKEISVLLACKIIQADEIAVKEYKKEFKMNATLGIGFVLIGAVSYFFISNIVYTTILSLIGIFFFFKGLELSEKAKKIKSI